MDKKKGGFFTALYAAPGFMQGKKKPGWSEEGKEEEGKEYPNNYDEPDESAVNGVYAAPAIDDTLPKADNEPAFVCVYAGPEWFAARNREREEAQKAEENGNGNGKEAPCCEGSPDETPEEPVIPNEGPVLMGLVAAPRDISAKMKPIGLTGFPGGSADGSANEERGPKFCAHCGAPVVMGANYCINCGMKLKK